MRRDTRDYCTSMSVKREDLMTWRRFLLGATLAAAFGVGPVQGALLLNDGLVHVIDQPSDSIMVLDSDPPSSAPTTAVLAPGGSITTVNPGLGFGAAYVAGASKIELSGGSVETNAVGGTGVVAATGGSVKVTSGAITTHGADSGGISLTETSTAEILGGSIVASSIGVTGFGQTAITVHGGTIKGGLQAFYLGVASRLDAYGGLLGDMDGGVDLKAVGGEAHFYGSQFKLNGVPVGEGLIAGPGVFSGRLTGVLLSGEPLDIGIEGEFRGTGLVYVHIPEPGGLIPLAASAFWGLNRRKRIRGNSGR
jgi:hypothetical protein